MEFILQKYKNKKPSKKGLVFRFLYMNLRDDDLKK